MKTITLTRSCRRFIAFGISAVATTSLVGCGSTATTGGGSDSDITISGALAVSSSSSRIEMSRSSYRDQDLVDLGILSGPRFSVDLTSLQVYCVTFALPPVAGTGNVSSSGEFSVTLNASSGEQFGCFIRQGASVVATLVFEDSDDKGMNGENATFEKIALSKNANLGSIELDLDAGKAIAQASTIAASESSSSTVASFDPTGTWKIAAPSFSQPEGYEDICAPGAHDDENSDCNGPEEGEVIYLKRLAGKAFTPDSSCATAVENDTFSGTCSGTTGSEDKYAMMIWQSQADYAACGQALGADFDEAKAFGRIDLTGSDVVNEGFIFSSSVEIDGQGTVNLADGWKLASAKTNWPIMNCEGASILVNGQPMQANRCFDAEGDYRLDASHGCVDSNDAPVKIEDWAQMDWTGSTCDESTAGLPAGYTHRSCTASYNGAPVTCRNISGSFLANGTATADSNIGDIDELVAQNALCSSIDPSGGADADEVARLELAQLQCYANAYWENDLRKLDGACVREIHTNWAAETADQFLIDDQGPGKAANQHALEILKYSTPTTATLRQEDTRHEGIYVKDSNGNGSQMSCRVSEVFTLTLTHVSSSKMRGEIVTETRLLDTGKPGCVANVENRTSRSMMELLKQ